MASITIEEAIITIASVVAVTVLASTVLSNFARLQANYISTINTGNEIMCTRIKIVYATNVTDKKVKVWVKNIGDTRIKEDLLDRTDIFFGKIGNFTRLNHSQCIFTILNGDSDPYWEKGETIEITINLNNSLTSGDYYIRIILYNGVKDEFYFSI